MRESERGSLNGIPLIAPKHHHKTLVSRTRFDFVVSIAVFETFLNRLWPEFVCGFEERPFGRPGGGALNVANKQSRL